MFPNAYGLYGMLYLVQSTPYVVHMRSQSFGFSDEAYWQHMAWSEQPIQILQPWYGVFRESPPGQLLFLHETTYVSRTFQRKASTLIGYVGKTVGYQLRSCTLDPRTWDLLHSTTVSPRGNEYEEQWEGCVLMDDAYFSADKVRRLRPMEV